jgi:hypothetical protein
MLSPEINYLVKLEQHKDRLRAAEKQQLLQATGLNKGWHGHRAACRWLGSQLRTLGAKLEQIGEASPPRPAVEL